MWKYHIIRLKNCRTIPLCFTNLGKRQIPNKTNFAFLSMTQQPTINGTYHKKKELNPKAHSCYYCCIKKALWSKWIYHSEGLSKLSEINVFPCDPTNSPIFIKGSINKTENVKCFSKFWWQMPEYEQQFWYPDMSSENYLIQKGPNLTTEISGSTSLT